MEIILEWYLLSHTEKMDLAWCDREVEGRGLNVHIAERILEIVSAHKISSEQVRANYFGQLFYQHQRACYMGWCIFLLCICFYARKKAPWII